MGEVPRRRSAGGGALPLASLLLAAGVAGCRPPAGWLVEAVAAGPPRQPAAAASLKLSGAGQAMGPAPADGPSPDPQPATGPAPPQDARPDAAASPAQSPAQFLAPVRVPRPQVPPGPRRVGLQAGHWLTEQVPEELRRLEHATGTSWGGLPEWRVNLDVANRAAAILRARGYQVDVLPTTVPPAYLADAFVALHADGDLDGSGRGFKAAHGARRGPYEDHLLRAIVEEYGRATRLPVDPKVTRNMLGYYAFAWSRYASAAAPHTPAAILEMGYLTNGADRALLVASPDVVATGVANSVLRFLAEVPPGAAFAEDLLLPPFPRFRPGPPGSTQ